MQAVLFNMETQTIEQAWYRAARRECIEYGDHGVITETAVDGHEVCFNCGGGLSHE